MSNTTELYVNLDGDDVVVTDSQGHTVSPDQQFTQYDGDVINLNQGTGVTIQTVRVSDGNGNPLDPPSVSRPDSQEWQDSEGDTVLEVEFEETKAVLKDENATAESWDYEFGITLQGGQTWDPTVHEEPGGGG